MMISLRSLTLLSCGPATLCPHRWSNDAWRLRGLTCRANLATSYHACVGDEHHRGKHVCRCGALRRVLP